MRQRKKKKDDARENTTKEFAARGNKSGNDVAAWGSASSLHNTACEKKRKVNQCCAGNPQEINYCTGQSEGKKIVAVWRIKY